MVIFIAARMIEKAGLTFSIKKVNSSKPEGTVVKQSKDPGTTVAEKTNIVLSISMGNVDEEDEKKPEDEKDTGSETKPDEETDKKTEKDPEPNPEEDTNTEEEQDVIH